MTTSEKAEVIARGLEAECLQFMKNREEFNYAFAYDYTTSAAARLLAMLTSPVKEEREKAKAEVRQLAKAGE
jgi:hypothetical protein